MKAPIIGVTLSTVLGGDYLEEPFAFTVGNSNVDDDFTDCTIIGGIYLNGAKKLDIASYVTVTPPATISIAVPKAVMIPLGVGVFTVMLWVVTSLGRTQPLVTYALEQVAP